MSTNSGNNNRSLRRRLVLTAQSPLALLSTRVSAQFGKSLDYLPGSAVRGAMAEILLNKRGSEDPLFQRIFVQQEIRFHDFWPTVSDKPAILLPLSASACKRYKFEHQDSLKDRLLTRMAKAESPSDADESKCQECGKDLDRVSGYIYHKDGGVMQRKLQRQLRMHVGISRARGSAQHGLLFSYEMLTQKHFADASTEQRQDLKAKEDSLAFAGDLEIIADDAETLWQDFLNVIGHDHLSVGKARTRGLGELSYEDVGAVQHSDDFEARWQAFNAAARKHGLSDAYCYFSLTLKSHLILRDGLGRPVLDTFGTKEHPIPVLPDGAGRVAAFLNAVTISGWNAAQGIPKPDMPALARGSVLGFRVDKAQEEEVKQQLQLLEITGLGERRTEGLGQITVCDSFHVDFA